MLDEDAERRRALWRIRMAHTIAWAVFAVLILAIPVVTFAGRLHAASWFSLLVWAEVIILVANRRRCPLTLMAARYTEDRSDNFDIFLPARLAKYNQLIFGSLFAVGQVFLIARLTLGPIADRALIH
jgi:hypothetical protein